uniref:RING-type domain-containing protein n=1 Tax=Chromera velia CCMP2878 TaxID=1169474 RepID=A0A0G4GNA7_9ALVE|eukprot:Cvel_22650.t1-p1 / transcript=Cvel_22650.t1 / gene=Cvel_22650 / organism=Chromera_velia_CCMP2878 / gene_product=hypothetical protein / transcript_product=hypothetical protein / location=Cvel_scaffold2249:18843-23276(+) / protein_length=232 / sequence_SO=supercontig / SO=protein_coding / is_pseudo=false
MGKSCWSEGDFKERKPLYPLVAEWPQAFRKPEARISSPRTHCADQCSVCMESSVPSKRQKSVVLSCGHRLHRDCAKKWFDQCLDVNSKPATCPKCRREEKNPKVLAEVGIPPGKKPSSCLLIDGLPWFHSHQALPPSSWKPNYRAPVTIQPQFRAVFHKRGTFMYFKQEDMPEAWPRKDPSSWRFFWAREACYANPRDLMDFDQWGRPTFQIRHRDAFDELGRPHLPHWKTV